MCVCVVQDIVFQLQRLVTAMAKYHNECHAEVRGSWCMRRGLSMCLCVSEVVVCVRIVQDIVFQLQRLVTAMAKYHNECHAVLRDAEVFPIEVDLSRSTFTYDTASQFNDGGGTGADDDDDDDVMIDEAAEADNSDAHSTDLISTD